MSNVPRINKMANNSKSKQLTRRQLRKKRRKKILIIEIIVLLVLIAGIYLVSKFGMIKFDKLGEIKTNDIDDKTESMLKGYTNIALFGVDNRKMGVYESGNSDSIMIASINNDTKEVKLVSVYRDTFMEVDGDGKYRKCNYAYNHGGATSAINMLNRNLDMDIEDYVAVDFQALADAIDAVDGVEITVREDEVKYLNEYLGEVNYLTGNNSPDVKAGTQTLTGAQATAYCRIRYTSGGDFERAARQRTVVEQVVKKAKGASVGQINKLIDAIFPEIATSLSVGQLIGLATSMQDYELVDTTGYPFDKATQTPSKVVGSVDVPCTAESNVKKLYAYLFGNEDYEPSDKVQEISKYIQKTTGYDESSAIDYGF